MPWLLRLGWRRVPWPMVWAGAVWVYHRGRERLDSNLTQKEQGELRRILLRSKGRPGSLSRRERGRLKKLAGKALRG